MIVESTLKDTDKFDMRGMTELIDRCDAGQPVAAIDQHFGVAGERHRIARDADDNRHLTLSERRRLHLGGSLLGHHLNGVHISVGKVPQKILIRWWCLCECGRGCVVVIIIFIGHVIRGVVLTGLVLGLLGG